MIQQQQLYTYGSFVMVLVHVHRHTHVLFIYYKIYNQIVLNSDVLQ